MALVIEPMGLAPNRPKTKSDIEEPWDWEFRVANKNDAKQVLKLVVKTDARSTPPS